MSPLEVGVVARMSQPEVVVEPLELEVEVAGLDHPYHLQEGYLLLTLILQ